MEWFNKRERRGILIFLPLLVLIAVGVRFIRVRSAVQAVERIEAEEHPLPADLLRGFAFDPNTVDYDDLLRLGFEVAGRAAAPLPGGRQGFPPA